MPPLKPSVAVVVLACACSVVMAAAEKRTVRGEVVAPACAADAVPDAPPESPAARTMRCARRGDQMAIQTSDALYLVEGDYAANNNAKLLDFVGKPVEAKGNVTDTDGTKTINVAAMMVTKPAEPNTTPGVQHYN